MKKTFGVFEGPGVRLYPGHQHLVRHTVGVEAPGLTVLKVADIDLLGLIVLGTCRTDDLPLPVHHLTEDHVQDAGADDQ